MVSMDSLWQPPANSNDIYIPYASLYVNHKQTSLNFTTVNLREKAMLLFPHVRLLAVQPCMNSAALTLVCIITTSGTLEQCWRFLSLSRKFKISEISSL